MQPDKKQIYQEDDITRFLQSGEQTLITDEVKEISASIKGGAIEKSKQIISYIEGLNRKGFDEKVFRKRTVTQIINDKYITGCTDSALLFVALARSIGLPAKYVETIDRSWLENGGNSISGHIYAQVYDNKENRWILVDPMNRQINIDFPLERVIFKEGLDSWDIGIKDYDSLERLFQTFRNEWITSQKKLTSY